MSVLNKHITSQIPGSDLLCLYGFYHVFTNSIGISKWYRRWGVMAYEIWLNPNQIDYEIRQGYWDPYQLKFVYVPRDVSVPKPTLEECLESLKIKCKSNGNIGF